MTGDTDTPSDLPSHVTALVDAELAAYRIASLGDRMMLSEFRTLRSPPAPISVNFSGGLTQVCYQVTRSNGAYSVFYLPGAACFSLCVDSALGPQDIGVHGSALDCFASV